MICLRQCSSCYEFENHKECSNLEQCYHGEDDRP